MPHGLLYGASYNNGVLSFTDRQGRAICNADLRKYLTFTATENNSSVALKKVGTVNNTYEYKLNDGAWTSYTLTTSGRAITLNAGDIIKWRCTNRPTTFSTSAYVQFVMTGKIEASNPVTSIVLYNLDPLSLDGYGNACRALFKGCTALMQAPVLPATTLAYYCYDQMFSGCTSLVQAPVLPAITLGSGCYQEMFKGCTSLAQAPTLPASVVAAYCYQEMFKGCTSLAQAPALPATTLATSCYYQMFYGCTSLAQAPALPATTLATTCYYQMFYGCTSLAQAPALPALSIPDSKLVNTSALGCYVGMFYGCTSLVQAPALPATTLGKGCYVNMFRGCTSLAQAPALPATTLPDVLNSSGTSLPAFGCYSDMFYGCTSLTQAPALPATTLGGACYGFMFYGCTSLTQAPALPATTLTFYCYAGMFGGCTSLNEIRVSATDISADRCTVNWTSNVSTTGNFYCDPNVTWETGVSGIPQNWVRHDIADYPTT